MSGDDMTTKKIKTFDKVRTLDSARDELGVIHLDKLDMLEIETPDCDACGKRMQWHGNTEGWGCPGKEEQDCQSSIYRPMPRDRRYEPGARRKENRYPELLTNEQQVYRANCELAAKVNGIVVDR